MFCLWVSFETALSDRLYCQVEKAREASLFMSMFEECYLVKHFHSILKFIICHYIIKTDMDVNCLSAQGHVIARRYSKSSCKYLLILNLMPETCF